MSEKMKRKKEYGFLEWLANMFPEVLSKTVFSYLEMYEILDFVVSEQALYNDASFFVRFFPNFIFLIQHGLICYWIETNNEDALKSLNKHTIMIPLNSVSCKNCTFSTLQLVYDVIPMSCFQSQFLSLEWDYATLAFFASRMSMRTKDYAILFQSVGKYYPERVEWVYSRFVKSKYVFPIEKLVEIKNMDFWRFWLSRFDYSLEKVGVELTYEEYCLLKQHNVRIRQKRVCFNTLQNDDFKLASLLWKPKYSLVALRLGKGYLQSVVSDEDDTDAFLPKFRNSPRFGLWRKCYLKQCGVCDLSKIGSSECETFLISTMQKNIPLFANDDFVKQQLCDAFFENDVVYMKFIWETILTEPRRQALNFVFVEACGSFNREILEYAFQKNLVGILDQRFTWIRESLRTFNIELWKFLFDFPIFDETLFFTHFESAVIGKPYVFAKYVFELGWSSWSDPMIFDDFFTSTINYGTRQTAIFLSNLPYKPSQTALGECITELCRERLWCFISQIESSEYVLTDRLLQSYECMLDTSDCCHNAEVCEKIMQKLWQLMPLKRIDFLSICEKQKLLSHDNICKTSFYFLARKKIVNIDDFHVRKQSKDTFDSFLCRIWQLNH